MDVDNSFVALSLKTYSHFESFSSPEMEEERHSSFVGNLLEIFLLVCWKFFFQICWKFLFQICWKFFFQICWKFVIQIFWRFRFQIGWKFFLSFLLVLFCLQLTFQRRKLRRTFIHSFNWVFTTNTIEGALTTVRSIRSFAVQALTL